MDEPYVDTTDVKEDQSPPPVQTQTDDFSDEIEVDEEFRMEQQILSLKFCFRPPLFFLWWTQQKNYIQEKTSGAKRRAGETQIGTYELYQFKGLTTHSKSSSI